MDCSLAQPCCDVRSLNISGCNVPPDGFLSTTGTGLDNTAQYVCVLVISTFSLHRLSYQVMDLSTLDRSNPIFSEPGSQQTSLEWELLQPSCYLKPHWSQMFIDVSVGHSGNSDTVKSAPVLFSYCGFCGCHGHTVSHGGKLTKLCHHKLQMQRQIAVQGH